MSNEISARQDRVSSTTVLILLAVITLLAHCATNFQYGFFRDELYYIQWSKNLAWGYVEQPPLTAFVIFAARGLLGDSLFALRFFPALCGALIVLFTGLMARQLGGGRFAQALAAVAVMVGPTFLGNTAMMTINAFDQLAWVICTYILIRILCFERQRLWLWFGVFAGLGLLNKLTMPSYGLALVVALLLTPQRRCFARKEIWIGATIALALFVPFLIWLATHNWVTIEFMRRYADGSKTAQVGFLSWFYMQVLTVGPVALPMWLAGLYFCLQTAAGRPYRVLGWLFIILYATFFILRAKFYFLSPAFPMLLAAGAVQFEPWFNRLTKTWVKPVYVALLIVSGAVLAPMTLPILPPDALVRYAALFGGTAGVKIEQLEEDLLPLHYADQFGWESMVRQVAGIYNGLADEDRRQCVIFGSNYGEAAAVDFYGPAYGLPPAISGHNTYHLWGPRGRTGNVIIAILDESAADQLKQWYDRVEIVGRNRCQLCMPYERHRVFFLCKGLKIPLEELWARVKGYG